MRSRINDESPIDIFLEVQSNPPIPPILGLAKKRQDSENGVWESYITYKTRIYIIMYLTGVP